MLPALTGRNYKDLEIAGGRDASVIFYDIAFNNNHSEAEIQKIRKELEDYCSLDTEGCLLVLEEIRRLV